METEENVLEFKLSPLVFYFLFPGWLRRVSNTYTTVSSSSQLFWRESNARGLCWPPKYANRFSHTEKGFTVGSSSQMWHLQKFNPFPGRELRFTAWIIDKTHLELTKRAISPPDYLMSTGPGFIQPRLNVTDGEERRLNTPRSREREVSKHQVPPLAPETRAFLQMMRRQKDSVKQT